MSSSEHRVLVVEDDEATRLALADALRDLGHEVVAHECAEDAIEQAQREDFGAVISDIRMPGMDGIELCQRFAQDGPHLPVVVMTAFGDVASAQAALRAGAFDFLTKPFTLEQVADTLARAIAHGTAPPSLGRLEVPVLPEQALHGVIGRSAAVKTIIDRIRFAAPTESTVLITGESGTGKEVVARAIHAGSPRAAGPFVAVSCAALPSAVLEAELFGHVKGAFTGATEARVGLLSHANGGTLFLDEIGDMPLDLQPKLLRVLQQRSARPIGSYQEVPFDARVVAATNRDLATRVASGEFREDLYYRLNIIGIHVPPLRERAEDINLLIRHFLNSLSSSGDGTCEFDEAAEAILLGYHWPGNVRELENCVRAAVALARNGKVGVDELPLALSKGATLPTYTDKVSLEEIERRHIALVLKTFNWNKALVARKLGIDRTTLYRKMKRYGLESKPR